MNLPKISVIMPSLNVGDYMEECLSSVLNQSFKSIEVICVDAGSTDNTLEIIKKHQQSDNRVKIINSTKKSYGHQVNLGLHEANGTYISIVETDDYIAENMLELLYNNSKNGTVDIIKGNFYYLNDYDSKKIELIIDQGKREVTPNKIFTIQEEPLFLEGHPSIWAGIYRKDFLEKNNIRFMEVPKGGWVDNPFFYESALKAESIIYLDKPVYYYRITNPNSSSNDIGDNTLPMKRISDISNILKENKVEDENILKLFYIRLFRYIELIIENNENDMSNLDYETCLCIHNTVKEVDEKRVKEWLVSGFQALYYKFISPLVLLQFEL